MEIITAIRIFYGHKEAFDGSNYSCTCVGLLLTVAYLGPRLVAYRHSGRIALQSASYGLVGGALMGSCVI